LGAAEDQAVQVGGRGLGSRPVADDDEAGPLETRSEGEPECGGWCRYEDADHPRFPSHCRTTSLGIAMERSPPITIALSPTTSPRASRSAPPELPGARRTSERMYEPGSRRPGTATAPRPLTTPAVTTHG